MIVLVGHHHSLVGLIYNNILVLPDGKVIGVLLGHCVFSTAGQVKAKYFNHTLYTLEGKMLAKTNNTGNKLAIDKDQLLRDAWLLIAKIKDHSCPIITPTNQWASILLSEHFTGI